MKLSFSDWLSHQKRVLLAQRHRALLVLSGDLSWRLTYLKSLCATKAQGIWVGEKLPDALLDESPNLIHRLTPIRSTQLKHQLGQETDYAILSLEAGFDADALAIVGGMIRAGGLCIISLPEADTFIHSANPASQRFLNYPLTPASALPCWHQYLWQQFSQAAWMIKQHHPLPPLADPVQTPSLPPEGISTEQQHALSAIEKLAFGHRKRPLLLLADRGRGKSFALGVGCAHLMLKGKQTLTLCAARLDQVEQVFTGLLSQQALLAENDLILRQKRPGLVVFGDEKHTFKVHFTAPDTLLSTLPKTDLLLIDEAAHLPLPLLQNLLAQYHRTLLSTTVQGYEGSGRGFQHKLTQHLDQYYPGWHLQTLTQPIRWQAHDPLENALNNILHLSNDNPSHSDGLKHVRYINTTPAELMAQPEQLQRVFQLLVQAHYQTRPNDLMQWLCTPNQQLWIALSEQQPIAVLFATYEGDLTQAPHHVHGHLLPQLMQKQATQPEWFTLKTLRIQRLAVSPPLQNQGIGQALLKAVIHANHIQLDALTVSFGGDKALLNFWLKHTFQPVYLSSKRDKASGHHSLAMVLPFSPVAKQLCKTRAVNFFPQLSWELAHSLSDLSTPFWHKLLTHYDWPEIPFPQGYLHDQPFEAVSFRLRQWTLHNLKHLPNSSLMYLWLQKTIQAKAWPDLIAKSDYQNRKALEQAFKKELMLCISNI